MKFYAAIGPRLTPLFIQKRMKYLATVFEAAGYTMRSGGAIGADSAFEQGVVDLNNKIIFRPNHATDAAMAIAAQFHNDWSACDEYARRLHGRNAQIILGESLDLPVDFVITWTDLGIIKKFGGTRIGILIAKHYGIPMVNLGEEKFRLTSASA